MPCPANCSSCIDDGCNSFREGFELYTEYENNACDTYLAFDGTCTDVYDANYCMIFDDLGNCIRCYDGLDMVDEVCVPDCSYLRFAF